MKILGIRIAPKWYLALIPLLLLTLAFDPIIIALGIVDYDRRLILGLRLFGAPIEDFMYAVLACIVVPSAWYYLEKKEKPHANN